MTYRKDKQTVGAVAGRQHGRIALYQLRHLGVSTSTAQGWEAQGYLDRVLPGIYAVGHAAPSREGDLWAALLHAGPGAMLSHGTQARWRNLIDFAPGMIEVSTPLKARSLPGIKVYERRRGLVREFHNGIPVTSIPVMMIDLAAAHSPRVVRRALGQLDFQQLLDVDALLTECRGGRRGTVALRAAIESYDPRRKYANGRLEEGFLDLCARRGLPLPVLNTYVHDIKCDAYWPRQGLVVELDGQANHSSRAQRDRDRRNDLALRSHGLTVHRYDWVLVHEHPVEVCDDVLHALDRLAASGELGGAAADQLNDLGRRAAG